MTQIKSTSQRKHQQTNLLTGMLFFALLLGITLYWQKFLQQRRRYQELRTLQRTAIQQYCAHLPVLSPLTLPSFAEHLAVIPNFLPEATFQALREAILQLGKTERSYFPIHKQGGTVAYETLHQAAPKVVAFFNHPELHSLLSHLIGTAVYPTPLQDQSACSVLYYTKPGDHINWHYDHNFYDGRHFTVLLPIVNQQNEAPEQLSSAQLMVKRDDNEVVVASVPNTLIVFEGAKVLHKVTRLAPDETRIMLSMTFATTRHASLHKQIARRIKDVAFFGIRALWT